MSSLGFVPARRSPNDNFHKMKDLSDKTRAAGPESISDASGKNRRNEKKVLSRIAVFFLINSIIQHKIDKDMSSENYIQEKEDNRVTFSVFDYIDVGQFLDLDDANLFEYDLMLDNPQVEPIVTEIEPAQEQVKPKKGQGKKRSSFHNFQKHLVTTIRALIDISKIERDWKASPCQRQIWTVFMNSNKINKTLVSMMVGNQKWQPVSKISEYGFEEIFRNFTPEEIKTAQQNIRAELLLQLREANLQNELASRRMKHKTEFVVYFQAFLRQLVNENLDKRMAKCTKLLKNSRLLF